MLRFEDNHVQVLTHVGLAAAFFASIYFYCARDPLKTTFKKIFLKTNSHLSPSKLNGMVSILSNHIMSIIHCMIQIPIALYGVKQPALDDDHINGSSLVGYTCMCIGAGYFLMDVIIMLFVEYEGHPLMMHGLFCFVLYIYGAFRGVMQYYGAAFILWECSTPFVHFRWLLSKTGQEDSTTYLVNGIAMTVAFFVCRCVWGTYISIDFWIQSIDLMKESSPAVPPLMVWVIRIADVALSLLNFYWFGLMLKKASAFLTTQSKKGT